MVGGMVIETCQHPLDHSKLYVNVKDRNGEECALYVEYNSLSHQIQIGDELWWQGGSAFWTPKDKYEADIEGQKTGVDFNIKIRRRGYSGVAHPLRGRDD